MKTKKRLIAAIVSVLALSGIVAGNLAQAQSPAAADGSTVIQQSTQTADDAASEAAEEASEAAEGPESASSEADTDKHEDPDGQDVDHQCPPDCDTANGETP